MTAFARGSFRQGGLKRVAEGSLRVPEGHWGFSSWNPERGPIQSMDDEMLVGVRKKVELRSPSRVKISLPSPSRHELKFLPQLGCNPSQYWHAIHPNIGMQSIPILGCNPSQYWDEFCRSWDTDVSLITLEMISMP